MGTMVRINEDNYVAIKKLADQDDRSVTSMTNRLLDKALGRSTVGVVGEYTPPVQKIEGLKPAILDTEKVVTSFTGGLFNELPDAEEIGAKINTQELGEMDCCQHPIHPCKHWVWDIETGEGYKNTLSGRYREAD